MGVTGIQALCQAKSGGERENESLIVSTTRLRVLAGRESVNVNRIQGRRKRSGRTGPLSSSNGRGTSCAHGEATSASVGVTVQGRPEPEQLETSFLSRVW